MGCPKCAHCRREASAEVAAAVAAVAPTGPKRPWDYPGYGVKLTGILDYFDGTWVGERARDRRSRRVPGQIIDKASWLEGFDQGWAAEWTRTARADQAKAKAAKGVTKDLRREAGTSTDRAENGEGAGLRTGRVPTWS